ncbi:hypothetical protein [Vibrio alginolyticus]|uniref:hypothetical protein n=1 Tax=Vibrio alginolyticus TaxID=663 RepID=UPI000A63F384|nr:hypothetical protein [Vibrio alginolyticus]CAH7232305.1 hypothetical protein VCHA53O474_250044 [Vibrio chagasii]
MQKFRVRFVSSVATDANAEWVTTPELPKGGLTKWVQAKGQELNKTAIETQPA